MYFNFFILKIQEKLEKLKKLRALFNILKLAYMVKFK